MSGCCLYDAIQAAYDTQLIDCVSRCCGRAIAASSVMSGIAVIMGVGLWYTELVAVYLFRQPDKVARVRLSWPLSSPAFLVYFRVLQ